MDSSNDKDRFQRCVSTEGLLNGSSPRDEKTLIGKPVVEKLPVQVEKTTSLSIEELASIVGKNPSS